METKELTTQDLNILIKGVKVANDVVAEENDEDLTKPIQTLKLKLIAVDEFGLCAFTDNEVKCMRLAVQLYIFNLLKDRNFDEATKAVRALNKLPE